MAPVSSKTPTEVAREILTAARRADSDENAVAAIERIITARDAEFEDRCISKVEAAVERVTRPPAPSTPDPIRFVSRTGERLEPFIDRLTGRRVS